MMIKKIANEVIMEAAQQAFPDYYIQLEQSDIFLKGKTAGRYRASWIEQEFFVSTEYAYEDIMVNGNKTRYKIHMPCILLKKNRYDVIYDSKDAYYVAYEDQGQVKFQRYIDVIEELPKQMELLEELVPV